MTTLNTNTSWNVGKPAGQCAGCGVELLPEMVCWAALCDGGVRAAPVEHEETGSKKQESAGGKKGEEKGAEVSPFVRVDYCEKCWGEGKRPGAPLEMFSYWKTTVPVPQAKKKLLVDDSVLVDVFGRMEGKTEPQEVRFRFVLALILMRKRLLKYEGMEELPGGAGEGAQNSTEGGVEKRPEVWRMIPRGTEGQVVQVINPHLTAEQITEVSQQLSAILAEEV